VPAFGGRAPSSAHSASCHEQPFGSEDSGFHPFESSLLSVGLMAASVSCDGVAVVPDLEVLITNVSSTANGAVEVTLTWSLGPTG